MLYWSFRRPTLYAWVKNENFVILGDFRNKFHTFNKMDDDYKRLGKTNVFYAFAFVGPASCFLSFFSFI